MASAATDADMDDNNETVSILAKVMAAGRAMPQDLTLEAKLSSTVGDLKMQIKAAMESHPDINNQRIIFQGRQLVDDAVLKQVFQSNLDHGHPIAIHVVIRPTPQTPTTTTVPSRSFFGGITTPSTPASSSPAPPPTRTQPSRPASNPPAAAPPQPPGYSPFYSRTSATTSRTSTSNGTVVRQTEITIRSERIVQTPDGNWQQQRGEARQTLPSDGTQPVQVSSTVETTPLQAGESTETTVPDTPSLTSSSGSSTARRIQRTIQTQTSTFRITSRTPGGSISSTPNNRAFTSGLSLGNNAGTNLPTTLPGGIAQNARGQPTYWLLQGPTGPASILTPPGGNAAPYAQRFANLPLNGIGADIQFPPGGLPTSNYPLLSPEHQEAMLRTQIDNIRRSNVERLALLEAERQVLLRQIHATENPIHIAGAPGPPGGLIQVRFNPLHFILDLVILAISGGNPNAPAPTQETILNALRDFWSIIWFAIKTLGMAYMLSTNGRDVRRDTIVWGGAVIILLLRIRLFETWLNALGQRLNAMIPDPNRPAPPVVQFQPEANAEPGLPNPQEVAQRWIQQHNQRQQAGVGGVVNAVQNGVSLFMASLIPGLGERVGNARAAEMERLRQALATAHAAAAGELPPNAEEASAEGQPGDQQQQAPGEAPGPQGEGIVDAARNHFGEERAGELFGQPQGAQEEVQPMFGL